jgi:hypothetical protein
MRTVKEVVGTLVLETLFRDPLYSQVTLDF